MKNWKAVWKASRNVSRKDSRKYSRKALLDIPYGVGGMPTNISKIDTASHQKIKKD